MHSASVTLTLNSEWNEHSTSILYIESMFVHVLYCQKTQRGGASRLSDGRGWDVPIILYRSLNFYRADTRQVNKVTAHMTRIANANATRLGCAAQLVYTAIFTPRMICIGIIEYIII